METAEKRRVEVDYGIYKDKMVDLTRLVSDGNGGTVEETVQGRVIDGNELGLVFKKRSQRGQDLVEAFNVRGISAVHTARLTSIGQKHLKPVSPASVRRHLVDFHGMRRSEVESMGPDAAMRLHDEIDHEDLGHDHEDAESGATSTKDDLEKDEILSTISRLRRTA